MNPPAALDRFFIDMNWIDLIATELGVRMRSVGTRGLYMVLLMVYAYQRDDLAKWTKHIITGAIAYLLSPIDAVPDLTPVMGFTDDLGVLSYALVHIAAHVNEDIRAKARGQLNTWLQNPKQKDIRAVDRLI